MMRLFCPPALHDIYHTPTARYSLFELKVPLNTQWHGVVIKMGVR